VREGGREGGREREGGRKRVTERERVGGREGGIERERGRERRYYLRGTRDWWAQ